MVGDWWPVAEEGLGMTGGFAVEATEVYDPAMDGIGCAECEDWDYDPFHDERVMECGLENPEVCESCQ